jgi:hypothetical protein
MRPSLRAQRLRVAPKQSAQRSALGLGVSGQAPQTYGLLKRLALSGLQKCHINTAGTLGEMGLEFIGNYFINLC